MRSLSDRIESYLRTLIERSSTNEVEIQRIELAETFNCVPSQITYVLGTRFTLAEGFATESKRGGRGYVRIRKLPVGQYSNIKGISEDVAEKILLRMRASNSISEREYRLLRTVIESQVLNLPSPEQECIRGRIINRIMSLLEGENHEL